MKSLSLNLKSQCYLSIWSWQYLYVFFGASVWFSSYAKQVFIQRRPIFETKRSKIQHEIQGLELEENTLTGIERIRKITKELGLVEPTEKSTELRDR